MNIQDYLSESENNASGDIQRLIIQSDEITVVYLCKRMDAQVTIIGNEQ